MPSTSRIFLVAPAVCLLLGACSDSSGPSGPNVAGLWTGTFRSAPISLALGQSGMSVSGTITTGSEVLSVTGEVTSDGEVSWVSEINRAQCAVRSASGMQLRAVGDSLVGVARRTSGDMVCDPDIRGRIWVEQGEMRLSRVAR